MTVKLFGAFCFLVLMATVGWAQQDIDPRVLAYADMVLYNGKILTADDQFTLVEAVAIRDGKFLARGRTSDILRLAGPKTNRIDLQGKTAVPGFIESHAHKWLGQRIKRGPDGAVGFPTIEEGLAQLRKKLEGQPPGKLLQFQAPKSKKGFVPSTGAVISDHEIDYGAFSADNPESLVYDENGVKIYAFPVMHCIYGALGYRLEWNGLAVSFHGDGEPNEFEARRVQAADVVVHEGFLDAPTFAEKNGFSVDMAKRVLTAHTTPDMLGRLFDISKPVLGVGYHYFVNDDTVDAFFVGITSTYDGPVALAQDLMVINVTPDQIVTRMGETDLLHWTPPAASSDGPPPELEPPSPALIPDYVANTRLPEQ